MSPMNRSVITEPTPPPSPTPTLDEQPTDTTGFMRKLRRGRRSTILAGDTEPNADTLSAKTLLG